MKFRHSVNADRRQLRRMVRLPVEFLIHRRVLDPKIRAQIQHPQPRHHQRSRKFRRHPMRQCEEHILGARGENGVHGRFDKLQWPHVAGHDLSQTETQIPRINAEVDQR